MEWLGVPWYVVVLSLAAVGVGSFLLIALAVSFVRFQLMTDYELPGEGEGSEGTLKRKIASWIGSLDRGDFAVIWISAGGVVSHGEAGERLMEKLAGVIQGELRADDEVVACGEDQWGLLVESSREGVEGMLQRLDRSLEHAFEGGDEKPVWRIGVVRYPDHGEGVVELFERAKAVHAEAVAGGLGVVHGPPVESDEEDEGHEEEFGPEMLDALTGVLRPEHVASPFRKYVAGYRRENKPVSVIQVDVDRLSMYNQQYGRECGDQLIAEVAKVLKACMRDEDLMGRMGVDGFAIGVGVSPDVAMTIAKRLHGTVKRHVFDPGRRKLKLTISSGVAGFPDVAGGGGNYLDGSERELRVAKVRG
ncbi:MAG TPA: diguanylate cyclase, partial [Kiritimatiellia bacterium]|nr:diguanylate cyclase [Kiritimatiellia bacterium]